MRKNRVRLTESQLHRVIKESVKRVLRESVNELDWKTYDSAMRKSALKHDFDRAGRFGNASLKAYNRDFGTHESPYDYNYRRVSVPYKTDMEPKVDDWRPVSSPNKDGWYLDTINAYDYNGNFYNDFGGYGDTLRKITSDDFAIRRNKRNQIETDKDEEGEEYYDWFVNDEDSVIYDNEHNMWNDNFSLAHARRAARRGLKDTQNYLEGNYEYKKGKGWHLKGKN